MMTDERIKQMRQSQWIGAQDRLPDVEGSYIICTDRGAVCSGHYYPETRRWNNLHHGHVVCWQKFPEPPEEGTKNGNGIYRPRRSYEGNR